MHLQTGIRGETAGGRREPDEGGMMKTRTGAHRSRKSAPARLRLLPLLIAGCFGQAGWANPQGAQVVNGQVGFQQQGSVLSVTNSPGAIINWQNFSINAGESTRFIQQSAASAVLNRVVGQDPSKILGALQSNGKVFLINPNGILFGQGARIDVNGLVASTLNISNEDFLKGKMNFSSAGSAGAIRNEGTISTPAGGQVYLIAPNIENSGIIHSPKGDVLLAAGHSVQLVDSTNPNLQVVVSAPDNEAVNLGQIISEGGRTGIYGALIRQRGVVSANSAVVGENGKIVFKASRDTFLEAGSVTTATGAGKGGEIQVLGDRVGLMGDAKLDASGQNGGGTVLVGGDYKGGNPLVQNAKRTFVSADASIRADAIAAGDGGKVIVWGDETTRAYGTISAKGGATLGNGGFVETSGKYLDVAGVKVDTRAPAGKIGTWLLDPLNLRVTNTTSPYGGWQLEDNPTTDSEVSATDLNTWSSTVVLEASNNIYFDEVVNMTTLGAGLVAVAGNDIVVNKSITTNGGDVSLKANQTSGFGKVYVNAGSGITTNGGNVYMEGNGANIAADILTGGGNADIHGTTTNLTAAIRSQGGDVSINGATLNLGGAIQSDTGYVTIGGTTVGINGVIQSNGGDIDITGTTIGVNGSVYSNDGYIDLTGTTINIGSTGAIQSGSGEIDIWATGKITVEGSLQATGYGNVLLQANKMDLRGAITTDSSGAVELENYYGRVDLGSATGDSLTDTVELTNAELGTIRTGTLRIYGSDGVHVSAPIALDHAKVSKALTLISNGSITQSAAGTIAARALALDAQSVDLQANNAVGVIAGSVYGDFKYRTFNQLTLSDVDGYAGITRTSYVPSLTETSATSLTSSTPGTIQLESTSTYGINQDAHGWITTDGATLVLKTPGNVWLNQYGNEIDKIAASVGGGLDVATEYDLQVGSSASAGISGITAGGDVRLRAGQDSLLSIDSQINAGSNHVDLIGDRLALSAMVYAKEASIRPHTSGRPITVGDPNCAVADCLSVTHLHRVAAEIIGIGRDPEDYYYDPYMPYYPASYAGPIHVAGISNTGTGAATDRNSVTRLIGLLSNEGVTQSGAIDVEGLGVLAGGGVDLTHSGNRVSRLFGFSLGGDFNFRNVGPLVIGGAPPEVGTDYATLGILADGGNINVSNTGHLSVDANALVATLDGNISLTAHSPLTVNGHVASETGSIFLEAAASGSPEDILTINGTVKSGGQISLKAGAGIVVNGTVDGANVYQTGNQNPQQPSAPSTPQQQQIVQQTTTAALTTVVQAAQSAAETITAPPAARADETSEEKKDDKTAAAAKDDGAKKNDSGKKLYCN